MKSCIFDRLAARIISSSDISLVKSPYLILSRIEISNKIAS